MMKRFAVLLALAGLCFQGRADVPPPEKILPRDTALVVTAPDWPKARAFLTNSSYGRLWQDPAIRPFKDKFIENLNTEALKPLEHNLGIKFSDYQGLAQGQVTFALIPAHQNPDRHFSQVLLIDTKTNTTQVKSNLASITRKWIDAGKPEKSQKIREADFTTLIVSPSDLSWAAIFPQIKSQAANDGASKAPEKKHRNHFWPGGFAAGGGGFALGHREGFDVATGRRADRAAGG